MRFHLISLFVFSYHPFIFITSAYSTNNFNKNNSSFNIDLYQCDTNITTSNNTTTTIETIYNNNLLDSCNISCCISTGLNRTTSSNTCQVTVQSSTGICLGRLCYSDECDKFVLLANTTYDDRIKNKTTIINQIRPSSTHIPWYSIANSTQIKWNSWIDKTGLTIRYIILIILLITNISLTFLTLVIVIKSIRHANIIDGENSYRYTLL